MTAERSGHDEEYDPDPPQHRDRDDIRYHHRSPDTTAADAAARNRIPRRVREDTALAVSTLGADQELLARRRSAISAGEDDVAKQRDDLSGDQRQDYHDDDAALDDATAAGANEGFVRLTAYQRKRLEERRAEEYSVLRRNILKTIDSHHALADKCHLLAALHRRAVVKGLRIETQVYEDMFATFVRHGNAARMALQEQGLLHSSRRAKAAMRDVATARRDGAHGGASAVSVNGTNDFGFGEVVWDAFQCMLKTHGAYARRRKRDEGKQTRPPHPKIFQHVMRCLQFSVLAGGGGAPTTTASAAIEERAHFVMTELERQGVSPTMTTVVSYIEICAAVGAMHIGMAAYVHALSAHQKSPTPVLCTAVIAGFLQNGDVQSAVSFISNMQNVAIDTRLFNTVLAALRESEDPLSAFAAFRTTIQASTSSTTSAGGGGDAARSGGNNRAAVVVGGGLSPTVRGTSALPVTLENINTLLSAWQRGLERESAAEARGDAVTVASLLNRTESVDSVDAAFSMPGDRRRAPSPPVPGSEALSAPVFRFARELFFLLQTSVAHRVRCGGVTLNKLLVALQDLELWADEEAARLGGSGSGGDDSAAQCTKRLNSIADRCRNARAALMRHMARRGVRIHSHKLLLPAAEHA